jgi:hypothetical protein
MRSCLALLACLVNGKFEDCVVVSVVGKKSKCSLRSQSGIGARAQNIDICLLG